MCQTRDLRTRDPILHSRKRLRKRHPSGLKEFAVRSSDHDHDSPRTPHRSPPSFLQRSGVSRTPCSRPGFRPSSQNESFGPDLVIISTVAAAGIDALRNVRGCCQEREPPCDFFFVGPSRRLAPTMFRRFCGEPHPKPACRPLLRPFGAVSRQPSRRRRRRRQRNTGSTPAGAAAGPPAAASAPVSAAPAHPRGLEQ
jgi:hypothetical protein